MFQVNESMFREKVSSGRPLVILFTADWCSPCKAVKLAMVKFEQKYAAQIGFYKVSTDECQSLCGEQRISSIPTLIFMVGSEEKGRLVGVQSDVHVEEKISEILI
jgi:thiol-disulfide isomerase/thioredoxin